MAKRKVEMERIEKMRAQQIAAQNRAWAETVRQSEEIFRGMDVGRGPVVDPAQIDALEPRTSSIDLGPIRNYQQPALLLALASGDFRLIQPRRTAALVYINSLHGSFANSNVPSCLLASDPEIKQILQDAIMQELGMDRFLSPNDDDNAAVGLGVILLSFKETSTQGTRPAFQRARNMALLKDQGFYDAERLAQQGDNCNADAARLLFRKAVDFVGYSDSAE
jgi:hypothetical protein